MQTFSLKHYKMNIVNRVLRKKSVQKLIIKHTWHKLNENRCKMWKFSGSTHLFSSSVSMGVQPFSIKLSIADVGLRASVVTPLVICGPSPDKL